MFVTSAVEKVDFKIGGEFMANSNIYAIVESIDTFTVDKHYHSSTTNTFVYYEENEIIQL